MVAARPDAVCGGAEGPLNRTPQTFHSDPAQVANSGLAPPSARRNAAAPASQLSRMAAAIRPRALRFQAVTAASRSWGHGLSFSRRASADRSRFVWVIGVGRLHPAAA